MHRTFREKYLIKAVDDKGVFYASKTTIRLQVLGVVAADYSLQLTETKILTPTNIASVR